MKGAARLPAPTISEFMPTYCHKHHFIYQWEGRNEKTDQEETCEKEREREEEDEEGSAR